MKKELVAGVCALLLCIWGLAGGAKPKTGMEGGEKHHAKIIEEDDLDLYKRRKNSLLMHFFLRPNKTK